MLFAGTPDGVYRASERPFDSVEHVFTTGMTRQLRAEDEFGGVFAATDSGIFHTTDQGDSWQDLGCPEENVYSIMVSDGRIYAGVRPADIYYSDDGGETWSKLTGFRESPSASSWPTNPHRDHAHVRSLASPPRDTGLLIAGVEVGGIVMSSDSGSSWRECPVVPDDVHHVLCLTDDRWIVSCGTGGPDGRGGVYRTDDRGETWTRLDTGDRPYVRASCYYDHLYTAANRTAPLWTPPDAALLVESDHGFEAVSYPGEPASFIISWTSTENGILAGTNDGRILQGRENDWNCLGTVPISTDDQRAFGVTSLAYI